MTLRDVIEREVKSGYARCSHAAQICRQCSRGTCARAIREALEMAEDLAHDCDDAHRRIRALAAELGRQGVK